MKTRHLVKQADKLTNKVIDMVANMDENINRQDMSKVVRLLSKAAMILQEVNTK